MIRLALHDPTLLTPALRREQLAAHEQVLRTITDALAATPQDRVPQHRLVIGPSGIGKTMLLACLGDEVPSRFVDCARGVASADALLERLPQAGERVVALLDGLGEVLEQLGDDAWRVREVLSSRTDVAVVGTAERVPGAVYEYGSAFFDFFAVDTLEPLAHAARVRVLEHLAKSCGVRFRDAAGVADLVGGTPRALAGAVEALLVHGQDLDPAECLAHVCDRLTPEFAGRVASVSTQAAVVLTELALNREPAHAKTIAARLGWQTNKVSSYLVRLSEAGLVDKVELPPVKTAAFRVRDPLFARWFLPNAQRA